MNLPVSINKLSIQMGVTSRTLRHWESEGLFKSTRDRESGWRVYDEEAVLCIRIISALRKLDIPLKDIKAILNAGTLGIFMRVIKNQLFLLDEGNKEVLARKNILNNILIYLESMEEYQTGSSLIELGTMIHASLQNNYNDKKEDIWMINNEASNNTRFITLLPMRMVYNTAIGTSPEEEAMSPVIEWLEAANLMGTARLFGGNVKPFPSSDDIYGSWQLLMKYLSQNKEYESDGLGLCLEEHIRNDNPKGQGSQYILNLLEPVKRKKRSVSDINQRQADIFNLSVCL